jgi:hypothetical protein
VAVTRPPLQGAEDEHVECALKKIKAAVVRDLGHRRRQSTFKDVDCLRLILKNLTARCDLLGKAPNNGHNGKAGRFTQQAKAQAYILRADQISSDHKKLPSKIY